MKIKQGDNVVIIAGKYKGKTGKVMRVLEKQNRATVEKINIRTRHIKKTATRPGERIKYEAPMDTSNMMLICPSCSKPTRVGYHQPEKGKKYRVCKKCKESVEQSAPKKSKSKKS